MLVEIIRELTKCEDNIAICSENVLTWAKRVEAQRAQITVIGSLYEAKKTLTQSYKKISSTETRPIANTVNTRRRCKYCRQEQNLR